MDDDGWIDDRELLEALKTSIGQSTDRERPIVRLRRQAWSAIHIVPTRKGASCTLPMPRWRGAPDAASHKDT